MPSVLILDCGATNIRAIAVNQKGHILAASHTPNSSRVAIESADYHIWDFAEIEEKLLRCAKQTIDKLQQTFPQEKIEAIGITTFGVDGAPFDGNGKQIYPVISWKCPRTVAIMQQFHHHLDMDELYLQNGVGQYSFNTLFKLRWLQLHQPEIYQKMDKFLFISSMIAYHLTGNMRTDQTMAGTSMMTNLHNGLWNSDVLTLLNLQPNHFAPFVQAGEKIGELTTDIAIKIGLSAGIPVISCGHDTQFALLGAGATLNQPVLSSGTWEILMARTQTISIDPSLREQGLTTELDAQTGYFNPAIQWLGSGILEWIGNLLYADVAHSTNYYQTMISEAMNVPVGCNGLSWQGGFSSAEQTQSIGQWQGLSIQTSRAEIYRSALEYMAYKLKSSLTLLQQVGHFKTETLRCVGGGSKNPLWNQIRADMLNLPLEIVEVSEATVLGAAMTTFYGINYYASLAEAQHNMQSNYITVQPSAQQTDYAAWLQQKGDNNA